MASDYCDRSALAAAVGLRDSDDDPLLDAAITAASRQIDDYCGRSFWQDTAVVAREFYATPCEVDLLDVEGVAREISTTTGLIVKTDNDGDGTFETTLTIGTDFVLLPRNAAADGEGFHTVVASGATFPRGSLARPGVQITAKFGWPAVPDSVERACIAQASQIYKSKDLVLGSTSTVDGASLYAPSKLSGFAQALLDGGPARVAVG